MAKFEVCVTEHVQKAVRYEVSITKKQVVEALSLEGDDAKEWLDHVQEYVEGNWEELREKAGEGEEQDADEVSVDIDDVTHLED